MTKLIVVLFCVLLPFNLVFPGFAVNENIGSTEAFMLGERATIFISFEHYKMHDGWTPVVLSIGELNCLLWMDKDGKVWERQEPGALFIEPVCVIDLADKNLRKEEGSLFFDVCEQNNIRTRWRLSSRDASGPVTPKIIPREKSGIELCLETLKLQLKHAAMDIKEFSPGLYHVQFHGPMMVMPRPMVYEKAAGKLYSDHEWNNKLTHEQNKNRSQVAGSKTPEVTAIPSQERAALIALYNSTNGDSWSNNSGWKTPPLAADGFALPGNENTWYGIICDSGNTTVQGIDIWHNKLDGTLPSELGNLANLQYLDLELNQLSGLIPPELGNLANLKYLSLRWNQLSDPIPLDLGNLANLRGLFLSGNQLKGPLPPKLGNLANLQRFYLDSNQLSGSIPPELGNLANLQYFALGTNQLTGHIPPELGKLANLQYLSLNLNQLSGPIPKELGNLANLKYLWLYGNQLSGLIPPELENLANLQHLYLQFNQLSDSIPPELGNLANLEGLDLSVNQLSGLIPPELGNLANLQYLFLDWNRLSGLIPPELGNLANLRGLFVGGNQLSGLIPPELGNLANVQYFWLYSNQLSGSIPSNLTHLANLYENDGLDLHWNALYTHDDILRDFLNSKQNGGDWESNQTIAPSDVTATAVSISSIEIDWTPIFYISDTGGYRVFYSTTPGGPYTYSGATANKSASSLTVSGLTPGVTYYFVVQTRTKPHQNNLNTVDSEYSAEVSDVTSPIILTSPRGGESWGLNTLRNITWTSEGLSGNIRLELWKADKKLGIIAANIPISNGTYAWTVGNYGLGIASPGNDYKVKIITANGLYYDTGNTAFSIVQSSLTLTAPHSNENWNLGTLKNITWTSVGLSGNVKLLLFKDGVKIGVIAQGIPVTNGTYAWTVGSKSSSGMVPTGSNYKVKIRSEENPSYGSGSGNFTIL